jgi:hypothetical protein
MPRLGLRQVVGSDLTFAAVLLPIAALGHLQLGDVNRPIAANMLLGSLPGVYLGSILCGLLPDTGCEQQSRASWSSPAAVSCRGVTGRSRWQRPGGHRW